MTPEIQAYFKLRRGYAELSRGRGFTGHILWGVTVRKHTGQRFDPDPSACYESRKAAMDAIEGLSVKEVWDEQ